MKSEALRSIRTMRHIRTAQDVYRKQRIRTTNSLSRDSDEEKRLASVRDRRLGQIVAKERARFAKQERAVERSRQGLLRSREKLAATINRNRALTELRHAMQRARWEEEDPPPGEQSREPQESFPHMELEY